MKQHDPQDSHHSWLEDIEYRREFGSESAKLEVASALAAARKKAGMTQTGLAELAGVSQAYIAKLERGDANPSIGNIGRLLACMWFKTLIDFRDIKPTSSFGWVSIGKQNDMEPFNSFGSDSAESQNVSGFETYIAEEVRSVGMSPAVTVDGR